MLIRPPPEPAKLFHEMPRPTSFGKDTGLQLRMGLTFFLLGALYVVFAGVLFAASGSALIMVVVVIGLALLQLFASDKLALHAMGAREVTPAGSAPAARDDRAPVRAGRPARSRRSRSPTRGCRTRSRSAARRRPRRCARPPGSWSCSRPPSSRACMAHELTHVANRDVLVMTLAGFFATIAAYIVQFGFFFGGGGATTTTTTPELHRALPRLDRRLHHLVLPDAGALALPRVRRRPRLRAHHRPPERARLGADEDLQRHGADPAEGPARRRAS